MAHRARKLSDEQLVQQLIDESIAAGSAAACAPRGNVVSITASLYRTNVQYYAGEVLARLARKTPPFRSRMRVEVVAERGAWEKDNNAPTLPLGTQYTIARVWYLDGSWWLELLGVRGETSSPKYRAGDFKAVALRRKTA